MFHGMLPPVSINPSLYGGFVRCHGDTGTPCSCLQAPGVSPSTDETLTPASFSPPPLLPPAQAWSLAVLRIDVSLTYLKISGVLGLGGGSAA